MNKQLAICSLCKVDTFDYLKMLCSHIYCINCINSRKNKNDILSVSNCQLCATTKKQELEKSRLILTRTKNLQDPKEKLNDKISKLQHDKNSHFKKQQQQQLYKNCLKRVKNQFSNLRTLIDHKQNQILASFEKIYEEEIKRFVQFENLLKLSKEILAKPTQNMSIYEQTYRRLNQVSNLNSDYLYKIEKLQTSIKPIVLLINALNVTVTNQNQFRKSQVRQNQKMKSSEKKTDFNRDESYNRIMSKLTQHKKQQVVQGLMFEKRKQNKISN